MEGYYWRLVEPDGGRVVVALCGVLTRADGRRRALVALAGTGAPTRWDWVDGGIRAATGGLGLEAGSVLRASPGRLRVDLGAGARLDVALDGRRPWPRRALGALGPAQLVPRLGQYWHAHELGGTAAGTLETAGGPWALGGAAAYAEKNWGRAFPARWWWGQAATWAAGDDACLAFAGGRIGPPPLRAAATAVVLRLGRRVVRLVPPLALVRARVGGGEWQLRARGPRLRIELTGDAGADPPFLLPVPPPGDGPPGEVAQHQAGRLRIAVREGRRTLWRGETARAGLEAGTLGGPTGSGR